MTPQQRAAISAAIRLAAAGHVHCRACGTGSPCPTHQGEYSVVSAAGTALNDADTEARSRWEQVKEAGDALAMSVYDQWPSGCRQFGEAEGWEQLTGKIGSARERWSPGTFCGCDVVHRTGCGSVLAWHHGPTPFDPDPAKMWCYRCAGEVLNNGNVWTCTGCDDGEWF